MLIALEIPPGVFANGTPYGAKGRWVSSHLVRWSEGAMGPVGGWALKSSAAAMSGAVRAILAWKSNSGVRWVACASHSKLYARTASDIVHDITPSGFTAGRADAVTAGGYGSGVYGVGVYGAPRPDTGTVQAATVCDLDTWGENLVFCSPDDGKLYEWTLNTGTPAAQITNAPTGQSGLVVTAEFFLFALQGRTVKWSDQADNTVWTAAADNQAGEQDLQTNGALVCGRPVASGTLLFTDTDVHLARFLGGTFVYGFDRVGDGCGLVSKGAAVSLDAGCVWMGRENFWLYDGSVQALPSPVSDHVFSDFNQMQGSKVSAFHNSAFGEVWWFYPSGGSTENDRAVSWNYRENHWATHELARLCAVDAGVFQHPMMVDASGLLYEHEKGFTYDGAAQPFALSAPYEIGFGDRLAYVKDMVTDERTTDDVRLSFVTRPSPNGSAVTRGPFTPSVTTSRPLFQARQTQVLVEGVEAADWRYGTLRLDAVEGAKR